MMVSDSVPHMLFECSSGHEVHTHMWNNVIMSSPPALIDVMNQMNIRERCEFIFSGFRSSVFITKWSLLYIHICNFITVMYDNKINLM